MTYKEYKERLLFELAQSKGFDMKERCKSAISKIETDERITVFLHGRGHDDEQSFALHATFCNDIHDFRFGTVYTKGSFRVELRKEEENKDFPFFDALLCRAAELYKGEFTCDMNHVCKAKESIDKIQKQEAEYIKRANEMTGRLNAIRRMQTGTADSAMMCGKAAYNMLRKNLHFNPDTVYVSGDIYIVLWQLREWNPEKYSEIKEIEDTITRLYEWYYDEKEHHHNFRFARQGGLNEEYRISNIFGGENDDFIDEWIEFAGRAGTMNLWVVPKYFKKVENI